MTDAISVSFCINDKYAQHLAVVITSILVNNPDDDFVFHVLHSDVTDASISKVKMLETMYPRHRIEFHRIDATAFNGLPLPAELEHVTIEMYYRFLLPQILVNEQRTIYSDVDVLCVGRLRPLWETQLGDNYLAAVPENEKEGDFRKQLIKLPGDSPYFYSGLLLMDLEIIRREGLVRQLFRVAQEKVEYMAWPDQDAINIVFRDKIYSLGPEWDGINITYSPFCNGIVIWHFPGVLMKPWCNIWKNKTWPIYLKYLLKSPYRDRAWSFVVGHIKGFFWFTYVKKGVRRCLFMGVRVWRSKA